MGFNYKVFGIFIVIVALLFPLVYAVPIGTIVTNASQSSYVVSSDPANTSVVAAGTKEANFSVTDSTNKWAGFFGNIHGFLVLGDAGSNQFMNWTISDPSGSYIYTSTSDTVTWPSGGSGINWTSALVANQPAFIQAAAPDNYLYTFKYNTSAHITTPEYRILNQTMYAKTFSSGTESDQLVTYALYDGANAVYGSPVYNDVTGYTGANVDYQLLVPVDDQTSTTFYFWIELS
jgi:hypothetical protein